MPDCGDFSSTKRQLAPGHFSLKINSFSRLSEAKNWERYESDVFHASNYKWKLVLYPKGNEKNHVKDYVSLYLAIDDSDKDLPHDWTVNANFKLFVLDHKDGSYFTFPDANGTVRKFDNMNKEWGFDQLINRKDFCSSEFKFLANDSCTFGVEVFVIKPTGNAEVFSMVDFKPTNGKFTWKIDDLESKSKLTTIYSPIYCIGDRKWKLKFYPNGWSTEEGRSASLYLELVDAKSAANKRPIYVEYKLRILDQRWKKHSAFTARHLFLPTSSIWGFLGFITLADLYNPKNGYILNKGLSLEVEFLAVSKVEKP